MYSQAKQRSLTHRDESWIFVFHDWHSSAFSIDQLDAQVSFMSMSDADCCSIKNQPEGSTCSCRGLQSPAPVFVQVAAHLVSKAFVKLNSAGKATETTLTCNNPDQTKASLGADFKQEMTSLVSSSQYHMVEDEMLLTYKLMMSIVVKNSSSTMAMGSWSTKGKFKKSSTYPAKKKV